MEHAYEVLGVQTEKKMLWKGEELWKSKHITGKGLEGLGAKALTGRPREMQ